MQPYKYHYRRYNEYGILKVNPLTWISLLYLCRHWLGLIVIGMALRGGRGGKIEAAGAFDGLLEPIFMLADIPAILVALAILGRHPNAGVGTRWVWQHGPQLIFLSALLYFGLLVYQLGLNVSTFGFGVWVSIIATTTTVAYVLWAPYPRDLFKQFPDPDPDPPQPNP